MQYQYYICSIYLNFSWILQIKWPLFNINQFTSFEEVVFLPILDNHLHWLSLFSCPLKSLLQISTETTAIAISYQCIFFCTNILVHMRTTAMVQCTTTNYSDPLYKLTWLSASHSKSPIHGKSSTYMYIYYMHWELFVLWWIYNLPSPGLNNFLNFYNSFHLTGTTIVNHCCAIMISWLVSWPCYFILPWFSDLMTEVVS